MAISVDDLSALGKSPEQIKQDITKSRSVASSNFIEKKMQEAFNMGFKRGFSECMNQYGIDEKTLDAALKNLGV